jgi:zinc D-Ala-D-Ala carboxypeptidase
MNLTEHFTLDELLASDMALRHSINNVPADPHITGNLHVLASGLERVRAILARPMVITSGYRNERVNKLVGGSRNSAHLRGLAADFKVPGMSARDVCLIIQNHASIGFETLIMEGTWTHIDFTDAARAPDGTVLTAHFIPGHPTSYSKGIK